jgi:hypothetical protein
LLGENVTEVFALVFEEYVHQSEIEEEPDLVNDCLGSRPGIASAEDEVLQLPGEVQSQYPEGHGIAFVLMPMRSPSM